jgi:serine/threonine-protein kinase
MVGNVMEWLEDWYERDRTRVLRGGSFIYASRYLRADSRSTAGPSGRNHDIGFRCARDLAASNNIRNQTD